MNKPGPVWDGINRRRCIRGKYPFTVHIYISGSQPITTYTEDISAGGLKLTLRKTIPQIAAVNLEIYLSLKPIVCKGKVCWVKERVSEYLQNTFIYDVGIEFSKVKAADKKLIKKHVDELILGEERK